MELKLNVDSDQIIPELYFYNEAKANRQTLENADATLDLIYDALVEMYSLHQQVKFNGEPDAQKIDRVIEKGMGRIAELFDTTYEQLGW